LYRRGRLLARIFGSNPGWAHHNNFFTGVLLSFGGALLFRLLLIVIGDSLALTIQANAASSATRLVSRPLLPSPSMPA